jgi:hypothetical protein
LFPITPETLRHPPPRSPGQRYPAAPIAVEEHDACGHIAHHAQLLAERLIVANNRLWLIFRF